MYTNLADGFLGYAYLAGLPDSHLWQDGIVLNWESMPGASPTFAGVYDLGLTLVPEAGHWFNLEHTFFGGCNAKGDFVADTPPMRVPTRGCPEGKDTCSEPGLDSIHNYMDYSDDRCYTEFTAGQVRRCKTPGSSTGPRRLARGRSGGPSLSCRPGGFEPPTSRSGGERSIP